MLDIRTLLGAVALVQLCCACGLWAIGLQVPRLASLGWFQWAYTCTAAGLSLGFFAPTATSSLLFGARLLVMAAGVLLTQGVAEYVSSGSNLIPWGGSFLLLFAVLDFTAGRRGHLDLTAAIFCLFFAVQLAIAAMVLRAHPNPAEQMAAQVASWMMGGTAALCLLRAAISPFRALPIDPFADDPLRFAGLVVFMVFTAGMAFGFIGMVTMRLRRQLEEEARADALTGLLNRRALEQAVPHTLVACRSQGTSLAVVAVDLDRFKWINDAHGHGGGDAVLRAAAMALSQGLRETDLLARVGGEEFVAVLPTRGARQAFEVAERLRLRIEDLEIEFEGKTIRVTASFGVAALSSTEETWTQLLRRADRSLYLAKHSGRNCTLGDGGLATNAGAAAASATVAGPAWPLAARLMSRPR